MSSTDPVSYPFTECDASCVSIWREMGFRGREAKMCAGARRLFAKREVGEESYSEASQLHSMESADAQESYTVVTSVQRAQRYEYVLLLVVKG